MAAAPLRPRHAGFAEVWAARAWNVLNEGRPFSVVYPPLAVAGAALAGLGPGGRIGWGLVAGVALSVVWTRCAFPLRGRALLWLGLPAGLVALQAWRAPGLLAVGLAGYALFTVGVWGGLYYRLRTGAPASNPLRFWRLVLTTSDPTSGNALEQVPKTLLTLSAVALVAQAPDAGSVVRVVGVALAFAALGALAWRRWARQRAPRYPAHRAAADPSGPAISRRVYVIVIDGCNRERLRQASALGLTPTLDRLAREGTEGLDVRTAFPARTVVCFSSMLTGAPPAEHGMRSNFAPRLGVRVPSIFDRVDGRLVGIAHLLDAFGGDVVRSVTSVQPTERLDHSLAAAGRAVVDDEDPALLVLQLLAADQLGHVRGTRSPEYLDQLAESDRRIGDFLAFLDERGRLDGATVIVMADHGQGRGIGGHGHLDWGEDPVPFLLWGAGAVPGAVLEGRRSILELAATIATLLGVPAPPGARGRPLLPAPGAPPVAPPPRALAIVPARDEAPRVGAVLRGLPGDVEGVPLDLVVVDDGSVDDTAAVARAAGAAVIAHPSTRGLGAALATGLEHAHAAGYGAALLIDGDGEYAAHHAARVLRPVLTGREQYVLGSRFLGRREGMAWHRALANRAMSALTGTLIGGRVLTDAQTGMRAFGPRALALAHVAHDYNHAQVLTIALHAAGIDPLEVPIDYRRRAAGASFVRYPEYARRVAPAIWRQWRHSTTASASGPAQTSSVGRAEKDAGTQPVSPSRSST